jgi:hypothetical protein
MAQYHLSRLSSSGSVSGGTNHRRTSSASNAMMYIETPGGASSYRQKKQFATPQTKSQSSQRSGLSQRSSARNVASSSSQQRRSSSAQKYSTLQVRRNSGSHSHYQQQQGSTSQFNSLVPYQVYPGKHGNPEDSDAGSVSSAPSLKYNREFSEYRDPSSSSKGIKILYRDESPSSSRRSLPDTPQRHTKTARKVIDGKVFG